MIYVPKTVYITCTGKKYHLVGCRYLADSKIAISLKDAKAKGLGGKGSAVDGYVPK